VILGKSIQCDLRVTAAKHERSGTDRLIRSELHSGGAEFSEQECVGFREFKDDLIVSRWIDPVDSLKGSSAQALLEFRRNRTRAEASAIVKNDASLKL
jgi:hypothetical protein